MSNITKKLTGEAKKYNSYGWVVIPLSTADKKNEGKCPMLKDWQNTKLDDKIRFEGATNIGVVTGKASNIACLDFDFVDSGMSGNHWYKSMVMLITPLFKQLQKVVYITFLNTKTEKDDKEYTGHRLLFNAYVKWSKEDSSPAKNEREFSDILVNVHKLKKKRRKEGMVYLKLKLKEEERDI